MELLGKPSMCLYTWLIVMCGIAVSLSGAMTPDVLPEGDWKDDVVSTSIVFHVGFWYIVSMMVCNNLI